MTFASPTKSRELAASTSTPPGFATPVIVAVGVEPLVSGSANAAISSPVVEPPSATYRCPNGTLLAKGGAACGLLPEHAASAMRVTAQSVRDTNVTTIPTFQPAAKPQR